MWKSGLPDFLSSIANVHYDSKLRNLLNDRLQRLGSTLHPLVPTRHIPAVPLADWQDAGGGSGGSGTARRAAGWYKKKVLLVSEGISGGCCVNVGYHRLYSRLAASVDVRQMRSEKNNG